MKSSLLLSTAIVALLAACPRADAAPAGSVATLALEPLRLNSLAVFGERPITLRTVGFQPRSPHPHYSSGPSTITSQTQIHGGFFDPDQSGNQGFVLGLRGGPKVDEHIQLGLAMDWEHRSDQGGRVVNSSTGPGGTVIVTRQIQGSSENTFPLLAYIQLSAKESRALVPYVGIAGGYEIVTLSASDYATGSSFNATYGGWGWQTWAGMRIPFSPHSGALAEVYLNRATAYRDVYDPFYNATLREAVGLDGVGMRFGLSWGI